jgi:hypothetical protein
MSRRVIRSAVALAALTLLAGCVKSKVVVHVNPDGSGRVVERSQMKLAGLAELAGEGGFSSDQAAEAAAVAQKMGEGVTVESVKELKSGDWIGAERVFVFSDISQLKLSLSPQGAGDEAAPGEDLGGGAEDEDQPVTFDFVPASADAPARLTVHVPEVRSPLGGSSGGGDEPEAVAAGGEDDEGDPAPDGDSPRELEAALGGLGEAMGEALAEAMLKPMLEDAHIEVSIVVNGTIGDTNARYVSTSRKSVGIARMDLGKLSKNSAAFKALMKLNKAANREEAAGQLDSAPLNKYLRVETQEAVTIEFSGADGAAGAAETEE